MAKATKALDLSAALDAAEESTGLQVSELGNSDPFLPADFDSFPDIPQGGADEFDFSEEPQVATEPEQAVVDEADEDDDSPFSLADIDFGGEPEQPQVDSGLDDMSREYFVPNVGTVPASELINGYLRQADYTQKTQEIAEIRRLSESDEFRNVQQLYNMLKEDTVGTVQRLAAEVGIVADANSTGERVLPQLNQVNEDRIEQLVSQRVQEVLQNSPDLQTLRRQQQTQAITSEMDRIAQTYGEQFSEADKIAILNNAVKSGSTLELTYHRMKRQLEKHNAEKQRVAGASNKTQRRVSSGAPDSAPITKKGIAGAYERALVDLQNR